MSKQREYSNERRRRRSLTQPEAEVDPTIAKLSRLFNRENSVREENIKSFLKFLEEAREATRATTRGRRLDPGRTQREVARADRKREARERAAERKERAADDVISQLRQQGKEEREAAAARANPEAQRKKALRRTLAQRMASAAEKQGIKD